jgi:hypothetical protein
MQLLLYIEKSQISDIAKKFPDFMDILGVRNQFAFTTLMCFTSKNLDLQRDALEEGFVTLLNTEF